MRFLKLCLWVFALVLALVFCSRNWTLVTVALWGDVVADINLPLLLVATFLAGLLPPWLVGRRRLGLLRRERAISASLAPPAHPVTVEPRASFADELHS